MQSSRLWGSLCVSVALLLALSTGVYSTVVAPTQTNTVVAIRRTETSIYSEYTHVYTSRSMILSVVTVTSPFTSCSGSCREGYFFYREIALQYLENGVVRTMDNLCILWAGQYVRDYYHTSYTCGIISTRAEVSYSTLTLTSTSLTGSTVKSAYYVTETHYENVPNPQKSNLQSLAVVLFLTGIAVAIILLRQQFPEKRSNDSRER